MLKLLSVGLMDSSLPTLKSLDGTVNVGRRLLRTSDTVLGIKKHELTAYALPRMVYNMLH